MPASSGGLRHFFRNNDVASFPWSSGDSIPPAAGTSFQAAALIQSNLAIWK